MESRKMVLMNLFAGQQWHRFQRLEPKQVRGEKISLWKIEDRSYYLNIVFELLREKWQVTGYHPRELVPGDKSLFSKPGWDEFSVL